jgi:hypothetical protein
VGAFWSRDLVNAGRGRSARRVARIGTHEVLQALAEPIDRPGHGHVELPLRDPAAHRVEARALVAVLGATDTVIILDLDDIASHARG